jgi:peroxiredoxin Q/BCP
MVFSLLTEDYMLTEQTIAPDFTLMGNDGKEYTLSALKGKSVVIYFYPKDDTPGCTKEACDFRDNLPQLIEKDCLVFGISKDSLASHQKFKGKYNLNFVLLSDIDLKVHKAYQVLEETKTIRSTFLIDKTGKINKIWTKVKVPNHVEAVIASLKAL